MLPCSAQGKWGELNPKGNPKILIITTSIQGVKFTQVVDLLILKKKNFTISFSETICNTIFMDEIMVKCLSSSWTGCFSPSFVKAHKQLTINYKVPMVALFLGEHNIMYCCTFNLYTVLGRTICTLPWNQSIRTLWLEILGSNITQLSQAGVKKPLSRQQRQWI